MSKNSGQTPIGKSETELGEGGEHTKNVPRQLVLFSEVEEITTVGGLDDMNLLEVLIGLPGRRRPPKGKTISVPWERGERSYYVEYSASSLLVEWDGRGRAPSRTAKKASASGDRFFIEVKTPESVGLPKTQAEDVIVALMKLSASGAFAEPTVRTTRHELLTIMKWPTSGQYYDRLADALSQLVHLTVETNALWDPERGAHFKSTFNILDSADLEQTDGAPTAEIYVQWTSKLMRVFERGYMKLLDTDFFYSLSNATTKRIYRWLDKQLTFYPVVEIDVLRFAHKVLGYGVSYEYPSQVIQKLAPWLDELYDRGFCRWSAEESTSDSKKKFVFTRVTTYKSVIYPRRDYVIAALEARGVKQAAKLVDTHGWERCLRQIEYHDFKGDAIDDSGAWLREAIEKNYRLPRKLGILIERAKNETARWCNHMYEGLPEQEKKKLWRKVNQMLGSAGGNEAARHRARNHVLLQRRKKL